MGIRVTVRLIQVGCCILAFSGKLSGIWHVLIVMVRDRYKVLLTVLQVHLFTLYLYFKYIFGGVLLLLLE